MLVPGPLQAVLPPLMPQPRSVVSGRGAFVLDAQVGVTLSAPDGSRGPEATTRFLQRLRNRTGLALPAVAAVSDDGDRTRSRHLSINTPRRGALRVGEDESYSLVVTSERITLDAATDLGVLRGLETLLQLLSAAESGYVFPAVEIKDAPRFPWRGLMIDSARHFLPVDVIKRNLDGMAAVKLNVLHWHLTDDQGFRIESKTFPRLHERGSDGDYYTQAQVAEIIAYADARGIRVYPEFDVPGHATSWLVGYPELASVARPYTLQRKWGIFDPALDPSNPEVYVFLERFLAEMTRLFPDEYVHIGGDEVNGKDWAASARIRDFMREKGLKDAHDLQRHFNERLLAIVTRLDRKLVGWDEILQPGLPTDAIIHSWRGRESMETAARQGYRSILSNGYYIDLMQPAEFHYVNDPLPTESTLDAEAAARVLGGEATMWSEHVTPETVDSRIWPRTAAIAERLWSPREVRDVDAMYERLAAISVRLEEHGLTHLRNRPVMMRRLTGGEDIAALATLADVVEPLKIYARNADDSYSQFSAYTLLPDIAVADAPDARAFRGAVNRHRTKPTTGTGEEVRRWLRRWRANHDAFVALAARAPALRDAVPLSEALRDLAELGLHAMDGKPPHRPADVDAILAAARQPVAKVELQVVDAVEALLQPARKL